MVAMFKYSQVTTYTAVLPPLKLEASISLRDSWLEKEFQSVSLFLDHLEYNQQLQLLYANILSVWAKKNYELLSLCCFFVQDHH